MENNKKTMKINRLKKTGIFVAVGVVGLLAMSFTNIFKNKDADYIAIQKCNLTPEEIRIEESKKAFLKAYKVFMHPRCMNCHPNGDVPLQGDDSHPHLQNVQRGPDGKGLYAMKCKNCHQDANLQAKNSVPGNPHWQMPPADRPMVFQGKTPKQLAIHFKDNQFTGFKSLNDMIKHVDEESLVISSFNPPAGVTKIPMSHEDFVGAVKEWIAKGAAIPDK